MRTLAMPPRIPMDCVQTVLTVLAAGMTRDIGKAHQRLIRERRSAARDDLFGAWHDGKTRCCLSWNTGVADR